LAPSWASSAVLFRRLGRLRRLFFAVLGVFGGSCSLQMPFKRVLHWKLAGNRPSKCSARALRGPCTLLKPSKSTVLSSDFMFFAFREGNAYSIALRRRFASTRRLGRAPVDALRLSWRIFGASWGALGLFSGCFGLPNSPQKSQSLPKSLKIHKRIVSGYVLGSTSELLASTWLSEARFLTLRRTIWSPSCRQTRAKSCKILPKSWRKPKQTFSGTRPHTLPLRCGGLASAS